MKWVGETVRVAISSLLANRLRTLLTVIGVIIGIGTIIAMLALINGINRSVLTEFERLGPNVIFITLEEPGLRVGFSAVRRKRITYREVEQLRRRCDSIDKMSIISQQRSVVSYRGRDNVVTLLGVQADYDEVAALRLAEGRFFNEVEEKGLRRCVLGAEVAKNFFGKASPLGKFVEIGGQRFRIIGVLQESGVVMGTRYDDAVFIPYPWTRAMFGERRDNYVMLLPNHDVNPDDAVEHIRLTLRSIRKIPRGSDDTFAISTQQGMLETYNKLTGSIYWVMRIVASIALLVSGIGIMNIMLVSVMERTREIGLRKAIGANRATIAVQFLIEAVILTSIGGIAGIGFGYLVRLLVGTLTPLPASVPLWAIPFALGICCGIGIFFGLYPALRASALDPVKALRYE